jgi:amino acid transporter
MLSFFVTAGVLVGFDASGHVAEETKNASLMAARGVFYSALASGLMGFPILILFLFCTPDITTLFSFDAPQPFVSLYALALGQKAHVVMNVVAIIGLLLV